MNTAQKLGVVKALMKRLGEIEAELKNDVRGTMPEDGGNINIVLGGKRVGTVAVGQPRNVQKAIITDTRAFGEWLSGLDADVLTAWAAANQEAAERLALTQLAITGEHPKGVEFYIEYKAGNVSVTGITFEKVDKALGGLAAPTIKLLEETND